MSLYEDMVQTWVDRREWDLGFHDQCKELVTAFFRVFSQQTGAHPIRPLRVDDWAPKAERDYSLAEALQSIRSEVKPGRTVLCGYKVCMGLLLEGPPDEFPRQMLAVHLTVQARDPGDRSKVVMSMLGSSKEFRLPLVLPSIGVRLASNDRPFPTRPSGEEYTERKQITWLHACLRNFRRLPPERRGGLAEDWRSLANEFGISEGLTRSSETGEPAWGPLFSQEESTSLRRTEALNAVRQVLLALGTEQDRLNQRSLEELSHAVSGDLFRLLLAGEEADPSREEAAGFSFRPFARPLPSRL